MRSPEVILDGLGDSVEVPLLAFVVSPFLKGNIIGTNALCNSVEWKFRDEVEWSVDVESEFLVESLGLNLSSFINVEDSPFLMSTLIVRPNSNWVSFLILCTFDIKDFAALPVNELLVLIFEDLEPS